MEGRNESHLIIPLPSLHILACSFSCVTFSPGLKVTGKHWLSPLIRGEKIRALYSMEEHQYIWAYWVDSWRDTGCRQFMARESNYFGQRGRKWNLQCWYKMYAYLCFCLIFKSDLWYKNKYQVFTTVHFSLK